MLSFSDFSDEPDDDDDRIEEHCDDDWNDHPSLTAAERNPSLR